MLVNLEGWKNLERKDFFKKFESRLMSFKKGLIRTNNDFTFLRSNNNYQLNSSIKFAENKFKKFDKIVVIGTGGSTLGAKAVLQIANKNRVGPSLKGIFGRKAGTLPNYRYSKAMIAAGAKGLIWSEGSLGKYIKKPRNFVKGTKMVFVGVKKQKDIDNLIAFLRKATQ